MTSESVQRYSNWMEPRHEAALHAHAVIGAAEEVHLLLGPGFREDVYEEAMCDELLLRGVPFIRHPVLAVQYKGRRVGEQKLDLLVGQGVIVDLLAVEDLEPQYSSKMLSYLKATNLPLGLLINFNVQELVFGIKRIISDSFPARA